MKIEYTREKKQKKVPKFGDIKQGQCFRSAGTEVLYIKAGSKFPAKFNAVRLVDGTLCFFFDSDYCWPVDAKVLAVEEEK